MIRRTGPIFRWATIALCLVPLLPTRAAEAEPIELRVRNVWQEALESVAVYRGRYFDDDSVPLALSNENGLVAIDAQPGDNLIVKGTWSAPLQVDLTPRDFERGYVVAVLTDAARVRGSFNRGPMRNRTRVTLDFADPWLIGKTLEDRPRRDGRFTFENLPAGLAFLTVTIEGESMTRRVERAIRVSPGSARNYPAVFMDGTATLVGQVIGPDGMPTAARIHAGIESTQLGEEFVFDTAADGTFEVRDMPNGRATFRAILDSGVLKRVDGLLRKDQSTSLEIRFDRGAAITCRIENAPIGLPMDVVVLDDHHGDLNHPTPGHARIYFDAARLAMSDVAENEITLYGAPRGRYTVFAQTRVPDGTTERFSPPASEPVLLTIRDDSPVTATIRFENHE